MRAALARLVPQALRERLWWPAHTIAELGIVGAAAYYRHHSAGSRGATGRIHPRQAAHPLTFRVGTSDLEVLRQVFLRGEYAALASLEAVDLVIDCGANVGYSAAYFLTQFPRCRLIAVEPDPGNFAMLTDNLAPYGDRVTLVQAAVWHEPARLTFATTPYRDGREWAVQMRACEPAETAAVEAIDLKGLLRLAGADRVSLLKIDIEGAEVELLRRHHEWLERVDALAIELHDDTHFGPATALFEAAIRGRDFRVTRIGDLTVCRRQH